MHHPANSLKLRMLARVAVVGLLAGGTAGCSSDVTRFGSLFEDTGNRQQVMGTPTPPDAVVTGSLQPSSDVAAPVAAGYSTPSVTSTTLPPAPGAVVSNAPFVRQPTGAAAPASIAALPPAPGMAVADPAVQPVTQPIARSNGWSAAGGTPVTLKPGESIQTLSRRYGVPESAIRQANGLAAGASIQPGQQLVIPSYSYGDNPSVAAADPAAGKGPDAKPLGQLPAGGSAATSGQGAVYVVKAGDSLGRIANSHGLRSKELAAANGIDPAQPIKIGQKLVIPGAAGTQVAALEPKTVTDAGSPMPVQPQPDPAGLPARAPQPAPLTTSGTAPAQPATPAQPAPQQMAAVQPTATPAQPAAASPSATATENAAVGSFRWPVRGRVISGYGARANGERNDGLNIEVPEGTPIKAAEGGTVIYAGNELKGYGNLVLVRHPNGYVSAYAHASEILVQRGDTVMRGQTIGKVGATGNVTRPQLHFELRNGNRPVDPLPLLQG